METVNARIAAEGTKLAEFEQAFDRSMHGVSKSLLALFIPAHALLFGLLLVNLRRRVLEHLVFATYYITFVLLAFLLTLVLSLPVEVGFEFFRGPSAPRWSDGFFSVTLTLAFIAWLFLAIRRFYRPHIVQTIGVAVLVGGSFFYLIQVYRMLLFHMVMHTAH